MLMSSIVGDGGSGGTRVAEIYGGSSSKKYYQEGFNVDKVAYVGLRPWQMSELMSSETLKSNKIPDKVFTDRQRKSIHKQMKSGSRWVKMAYCEELGKARVEDLKFWKKFGHTIDTSQFCKVKLFKLLDTTFRNGAHKAQTQANTNKQHKKRVVETVDGHYHSPSAHQLTLPSSASTTPRIAKSPSYLQRPLLQTGISPGDAAPQTPRISVRVTLRYFPNSWYNLGF